MSFEKMVRVQRVQSSFQHRCFCKARIHALLTRSSLVPLLRAAPSRVRSEKLRRRNSERVGAREEASVITLRQAVADLMVAVHEIRPEVAAEYAGEMTEVELAWKFEQYMNRVMHCPRCDYPLDPLDVQKAVCPNCGRELDEMETELSAAGANPRRVNVSSTPLFTPLTTTARLLHSALFPFPRPGAGTANSLPESEKEATGSEVGGGP